MPNRNRPHADIVEPLHRAVRARDRTFAPKLVEAVAKRVAVVPVSVRKAPSVEMGPAFAVLVNFPAVREQGTIQGIEFRKALKGEIVQNCGEEIVGARRAARDVNQGLVGDEFAHANGAGWVRRGCRNSPKARTSADAEYRFRSLRGCPQRLSRGP